MTALQTTQKLPAGRHGLAHAARMEWIKLRSLRSTLWALVATVAGMLVIGIVTMANTHAPSPDKADTFDPVNNVLAGIALGQLIVGVLGVLVVTGEYSSGAIRSTLTAVPNRPLLLAAKAGVFGTVTLILGEVVAFATFFAGRLALSDGVWCPASATRVCRARWFSRAPISPWSGCSVSRWAPSSGTRPRPSEHWSGCCTCCPRRCPGSPGSRWRSTSRP